MDIKSKRNQSFIQVMGFILIVIILTGNFVAFLSTSDTKFSFTDLFKDSVNETEWIVFLLQDEMRSVINMSQPLESDTYFELIDERTGRYEKKLPPSGKMTDLPFYFGKVNDSFVYPKGTNYTYSSFWPDVDHLVVGYEKAKIDRLQATFLGHKAFRIRLLTIQLISLIAALILLVWLITTVYNANDSFLASFDVIPLAFIFLLMFLALRLGVPLLSLMWESKYSLSAFIPFITISGILFALFLLMILLFTSRIKRRVFFKTTVIGYFFQFLSLMLNALIGKKKTAPDRIDKRQYIFLALCAFIVIFFVIGFSRDPIEVLTSLGVVLLSLSGWFVYSNQKDLKELKDDLDLSLSEKIESERTKVELITNVSHDLKTPLTSIISYIDLLKKEELSETATEYVTILSEKSERLKRILSDVFEVSKASSGELKLELQELDLKTLLQQMLLDYEEKIEESGLDWKIDLPEESVYVVADGTKLYRVFQNLFDNATKYAMKNTRVFLTLKNLGERCEITLMNTANYPLDFTEEEVLRRFYRADISRTTEGSGLGLSIAETFTSLMGGDFQVKLEGDLFKIHITLPVIQKEQKGIE
ncbi:sensor histidine kinase [Guggenheimella bovis]